jgi:hypothetical protein
LLIGAPLVFTAFSALRVAPHQLAYFNEWVGGPEEGYRYLSDSNLDWGQDLKGLKAYMEKENLPMIYFSYFGTAPPAYYGIHYQYVPGTWPLEWPPPTDRVPDTAPRKILAISVYNLQDVSNAHAPLFRWLWQRQPIAKIGYSIFVYDLTADAEGLARLEETYAQAGIPSPGERFRPENPRAAEPSGLLSGRRRFNSGFISPNRPHRQGALFLQRVRNESSVIPVARATPPYRTRPEARLRDRSAPRRRSPQNMAYPLR